MKQKNSNGITLISLVVSIIVLMIISGISINIVVGEDGIIGRVMDAKLMTDLSDDLFEMESDMVNIRIGQLGRKLKVSELISGLIENVPGKYSVTGIESMHTSDLLLSNTRTNPIISYSGDVFVNNYKRGKVQLADITTTVPVSDLGFGDFTITVNDGSATYYNSECIIKSTEAHPVFWINQDSEIMAFADTLRFMPYGLIENYELTELDIFDLDDAYQTFYDQCNDAYMFNVTFDYKKLNKTTPDQEDTYEIESFGYHFTEDVTFQVGDKEIKIAGMNAVTAGLLYAPTREELTSKIDLAKGLDGIIYKDTDGKIKTPFGNVVSFNANGMFDSTARSGSFQCGDSGELGSWLFEVRKSTFIKNNEEMERVYYIPFILYQKYVGKNPSTGEKMYTPNLFIGTANYISFIDI